jgi:hypothetical protein
MGTAVVVAFIVAAAFVATLWPVFVYVASLATFGLAHVIVELRYVDARFGRRLPATFWHRVLGLLLLIVVVRSLLLSDVVPPAVASPAELVAVAALVFVALPPLWASHRRHPRSGTAAAVAAVCGLVAAAALLLGAARAPLVTLLGCAVLHNATPWLFIVERAPPARRAHVAFISAVVFVGVPMFVAAGATSAVCAVSIDHVVRPWPTGPLVDHYAAYLPPSLRFDPRAAQLFSGAVTAQLLHYGAVLVWLPRSLTAEDRPCLPWPRPGVFLLAVVGGSIGLLAHFVADFFGARALYGLAAAAHAWIEWPVLLAGLGRAGSEEGSDRHSEAERTPRRLVRGSEAPGPSA